VSWSCIIFALYCFHLQSSQSCADDGVAKQGTQDIASSGSSDVAPSQQNWAAQCLSKLSEGWTLAKITRKGDLYPEIHFKSPNLKLEFRSYSRADEFDRMLATHPEGEESAAVEYMYKVGGYVKLMNYVCDVKKHTFLQEAKVPKQTNKEVCTMFNVKLLFICLRYIYFIFVS
jgi:hypothetical protein